jgi:hypothetical protein
MLPRAVRFARHTAMLTMVLIALVVVELPGTTSASSTPAAPSAPAVAAAPPQQVPDPQPLSFRIPGDITARTAPLDEWLLGPWLLEASLWEAASLYDTSKTAEMQLGARMLQEHLQEVADRPRAVSAARPDGPLVPPSYFEDAMVVSFYGHPDSTYMGELGFYTPVEAARAVRRVADQYAALAPGRRVLPALHLIVDTAQPLPQADGQYLLRMPLERIEGYVEAARAEGALLFLDLQLGWSDPLTSVRRLEPFLAEPFVHLALDPEFATKPMGRVPGEVIGTLDAGSVNEVQHYLAGLVREHRLPRKVLVLHQFLDTMLAGTSLYHDVPEVEITVDMDGFGPDTVKAVKYGWYALADYSERAAIKLFYHWDAPLMSPADILALDRAPDYVIYQ